MGKTYFIADLHFGHVNCLAYDNRPFKNIDEQDAALVERWNSVVTSEDDVYILGDISWYGPEKTAAILRQLKGRKHLIIGNHDKKLLKSNSVKELFVDVYDYLELPLTDGKGIVLCHYPIPCFNKHFYGWYHLYGHVHTSFEWNMMKRAQYEMAALYDKECLMYNVGVMVDYMDYTPRTLEEILGYTAKNEQEAQYVH